MRDYDELLPPPFAAVSQKRASRYARRPFKKKYIYSIRKELSCFSRSHQTDNPPFHFPNQEKSWNIFQKENPTSRITSRPTSRQSVGLHAAAALFLLHTQTGTHTDTHTPLYRKVAIQ